MLVSFDAALAKVAARYGPSSVEWAMMALDRPFLLAFPQKDDVNQYNRALEILVGRTNQRAVLDLLFWHFTIDRPGNLSFARRRHLTQVLNAHRAAHGDRPEQRWLWAEIADAGQYGPSQEASLELLMKYLTAMQAAGSPEGRIDAIARILRHPIFQKVDKTKRLELARFVFPDLRRQVDAATATAKQAAVAGRASAADDCIQHIGEEVGRTLIAGSSGQESLDALRVLARMAAIQGTPATDFVGAYIQLGPLIALRASEPAAYAEGAEIYGFQDTCKVPADRRSICLAFDLARVMGGLKDYEIALRFAEDGLGILDARTDPFPLVEEHLVGAAELHWKNGSAARARTLLDMIEQRPESSDPFSSEFGIDRLVLRARVAEALLDDRRAGEIVRTILTKAAGLPPRSASIPANARLPSPAETALVGAADGLSLEIVRRRFCTSCEADVLQLAVERQRGIFDGALHPPSGEVPDAARAASSFLALRRQPPAVVPRDEQVAMARALAGLPQRALRLPEGATPENTRRRLNITDTSSLAAILATYIETSGLPSIDSPRIESFISFVSEKNFQKKYLLWKKYFDSIAESVFEQFGAEDALVAALDGYARDFMDAGYPMAARAILSDLIARSSIEPSVPAAQRPALERNIARNAVLLVSVQARLAGLALDARDVAMARRHLGEAQAIAVGRLRAEWHDGDERSVGLVRQLRPALRLTAQTWLRIALDRTSAQPSDVDKALETLQIAMLGDTALATFAAERRKLLADPTFRVAREALNRATSDLRLIESAGYSVGTLFSPSTLAQMTKTRRDAATLAERAPVLAGVARLIDEALAPISAEQLRRTLRAGEGHLVLHAATDAVWGILLRANAPPLVWRSPISLADLERRVAAVRSGLTLSAAGGLPPFSVGEAHDLAGLVFGSALPEIGRLSALTLQVDGPLSVLPFNVLPLAKPELMPEDPSGFRTAGVQWLGTTVALRFVPSAAIALQRPRAASSAQQAFLGIGDPVLSGEPNGVRSVDFARVFGAGGLADPEALRRLAALPGTRTEVQQASALLGSGRVLLGAEASERTIRSMPLDGYRVILFATHGLTAGETGDASEPGLVLTPPSQASVEDDGLLTASEIQRLRLDADLVILSACNTGGSDGKPRAEGLTGLARAFLAAGAHQLIVTGWSIPSEPTAALVSYMLEQPGGDRARALRDAMRWLAESHGGAENAHPAMWGAFMLTGGGDGRS